MYHEDQTIAEINEITAWNKLSSQMSKMAETNKLLKRKNLTSILRQPPKKTSKDAKTPKNIDKTVKFEEKSNKGSSDANMTPKSKTVKNNNNRKHYIYYSK